MNELNAFFISRELDNLEIHQQIRTHIVVSNRANKEKLGTLTTEFSDNTASMCIQNIQNQWQQYHNQFVLMCQFLFELVKHFPAEQDQNSLFSNATKSFIDFYVKICNFSCTKNKPKPFCDTEQYGEVRKLLKLCSTNTTNEIATTFGKLIEVKVFNEQANYQSDFLNDIHEFCETLAKIRQNFTVSHSDNSFNEDDAVSIEAVAVKEDLFKLEQLTDNMIAKKRLGAASLNRRSSIRTLKPIQENSPPKVQRRNTMCISQATKKQLAKSESTRTIEQAKMEMFEWLSHQFSIYFDNDYSTHLPYSGYFCYSKLSDMKKRLFDIQRINVHNCLLNSYSYLKTNEHLSEINKGFSPKNSKNLRRSPNSGRVIDESNNDHLLPLNMIYKIYLECGHMINLFDWLQV